MHIKAQYYITLAAGAIMLMIPALINGYPLVNSDTSTYISSGFTASTPWDRPITYGVLLYILSLGGTSMWFAVAMQGYIISWLVTLSVKNITGKDHYVLSFVTLLLLSTITSLSWVTSELIADMYTGVMLLCMALLLIGKETKSNRTLLYILFFVSVATHTSHLVYGTALLVLLLLTHHKLFRHLPVRKTRNSLLIMLALSLSTIGIMGACMAKTKQMFMMGSLLDKGILKPALDDLCADTTYNICKYKDNLPADVNEFLWEDTSPMQQEGGWRATQPEYRHIINSILSKPGYLWMYTKISASYTFSQLVCFNIGDGNTGLPNGSNVSNTIAQYLPHESRSFLNSRQNTTGIKQYLSVPNAIISIVTGLSVLLLGGLLYFKRAVLPPAFYVLLAIVVLGILINAWSCATFSQVNGRYGCRVMWLLPLMAIIASAAMYFLPQKVKSK